MISAVDTNVLLDILLPDTRNVDASKKRMDDAYADGALIICEVVYSELAAQFCNANDLEAFLLNTGIRLVPSGRRSLQAAAVAWQNYTIRRDMRLQCASCGNLQDVCCSQCGMTISSRQHIIPDFIIGAHAVTHADRLLTRDRGFYRTYFPELILNI